MRFLIPFLCFISSVLGYEVLSLGPAIADYFVFVTDEELSSLQVKKGGWQAISEEEWQRYYEMYPLPSFSLGGSSLNVLKSLSQLGVSCAFLGKIGPDHTSRALLEKMESLKICSLMEYNDSPTAKMFCFVTPDKDRTMRTFQGSADLSDLKFSFNDFENIRIFHVAGYEIVCLEMLKKAFSLAKAQKALISMDLGSARLVEEHREDFLELIQDADIVFANADEARALTDLEPMYAVHKLSSLCPIAVVTMGDQGGWVKKGKEHFYYPAIKVEPKDTTGAGDFFTSGFLFGLLQKKSLKDCAYLGAYLASEVVKEIGTDLPESTWEKVRQDLVPNHKSF